MTGPAAIAALVVCAQFASLIIVIRRFAASERSWRMAALCSFALAAAMSILFVTEELAESLLDALDHSGVLVFDYVRYEIKMLQFALAVVGNVFAMLGFCLGASFRRKRRTPLKRLLPIAGMLIALAACGLILFAIPAFSEVFRSFGDDLPWQTRSVLTFYKLVAVFPLLVCWTWSRWNGEAAALLGIVGSAALLAYSIWACYSPIFV
ncbi:MAG TPA: hypothetical protein VIE65_14260 [Methylobacter sp.]|jgi:hypothetical protein